MKKIILYLASIVVMFGLLIYVGECGGSSARRAILQAGEVGSPPINIPARES